MTKATKEENNTKLSDKAVIGTLEAASHKKHMFVSLKSVVVSGLMLLLFILFGWFMFQNTSLNGLFSKEVCDEDVVSSYNSLSVYELRSDSDEPSVDIEGLNKLAADITSKKGYKDDPTCQVILLEIAIFNNDYNSAKDALTAVEQLDNKKKYAETSVARMASLDEYKIYVKQLEPSSGDESQEAQGGE